MFGNLKKIKYLNTTNKITGDINEKYNNCTNYSVHQLYRGSS